MQTRDFIFRYLRFVGVSLYCCRCRSLGAATRQKKDRDNEPGTSKVHSKKETAGNLVTCLGLLPSVPSWISNIRGASSSPDESPTEILTGPGHAHRLRWHTRQNWFRVPPVGSLAPPRPRHEANEGLARCLASSPARHWRRAPGCVHRSCGALCQGNLIESISIRASASMV